jgi:hypothetical protein
MFRLGGLFSSLLELIAVGLGMGIIAGLLLAPVAATLYWGTARILGGKGSFRDSLALIAYSLVPLIVAVIFLLPIELLTFGMYLFTHNPHPSTLKPELYIILIGLDAASVLWTLGLLFIGTYVGHQIGKMKSVFVTGLTATLIIAGLYAIGAAIGGS